MYGVGGMNKVLVTGGGGFIGKALVRELVGRGITVSVVGRSAYPELEQWGVQCHKGDIRDLDRLKKIMAGHETVFHTAAKAGIWGSGQEYSSINVTGTKNVIEACRHNGVSYLVYTSTPSVVFDGYDLQGVDESTPYASRPLCRYALTKIQAEQAILGANGPGLRTVAIRPHLVWGPGDQHLIPRLLERGRAGALKRVGTGTNRVDITYIDNVVHAHILAAENLCALGSAAGEAFFIGQEEPVNLWQWINVLFERTGIVPVTREVPYTLAYGVGLVSELVYSALRLKGEPKMTRFVAQQMARSHWFSHAKAKRILGYRELVSMEQGLDTLIDGGTLSLL